METSESQRWRRIVWDAYQRAFEDAPVGWRIDIFEDGGISSPLTGGTEVYCKSHGINERCRHCRVVASVEGFDALDVPCLYDTDEDDHEREGFVYDREAQEWVPNTWDEISIYIEEWAAETVSRLIDRLEEE